MVKSCAEHKDRSSATMCHQCHKPICRSCTLVTPQGSFCSSECSLLRRESKGEMKRPRAGFVVQVAALFVLLVAGFVGIHLAAPKALKRFDLIGGVLERIKNVPSDSHR